MTQRKIGNIYPGRQFQIPAKGCLRPIWVLAVIFATFSMMVYGSVAEEKRLSEYQVKAAYLYNFTKFVEWPPQRAGERQTFTIVVLGKNPFGDALNPLTGKLVYDRKVQVKYIRNIAELPECDLLFISTDEARKLDDVLAALIGQQGTLTVSDARNFAARGGMIGFVNKEERIQFEINHRAARRANLSISSNLLKLALVVVE